MGRQAQEEVAAAARRRLELLGRELDQAGLRRVDDPRDHSSDDPGDDPSDDPWDDRWETRAPWDSGRPDAPAVPARSGRSGRHALTTQQRRLGARLAGLLPDSLRGRVGLTPPSVLLVVALVAVAAVVTAVAVLRMNADSQPVAATGSGTPLVPIASASPSTRATTAASAASAAANGTVTVDVAGKVRRPGVITLPSGSRVIDALRRAGGARGGVDLSGLNLARVLVDGEQILVGRSAHTSGRLAAGAAAAAPAPTGGLVDLNTATEEQLDTLPGVGPVTAQKILAWRTAHGAFTSVDELLEVDGIGEKTLAELAPKVTL